jgi:hypothetical protein
LDDDEDENRCGKGNDDLQDFAPASGAIAARIC